MNPTDFERHLAKYAEVIVKVGLNLQPGQRLLIGASSQIGGTPLDAAPLVRHVTAQAYQAGAQYVDVIWHDSQLELLRLQHAPRDSFGEYANWKADLALEYAQRGDAFLRIYGRDPDLLAGQDLALVRQMQQTAVNAYNLVSQEIGKPSMNWLIIGLPVAKWAAKVLPHVAPDEQVMAMWDALFDVCRIKQADPVAAWHTHLDGLRARAAYLNERRYSALHYTAPGTDLQVGLVDDHVWVGAGLTALNGVPFTANIPTEEVFCMPHKDRVDGVVTSTKPLSHGGKLIDNFNLTFKDGRVVEAQAEVGDDMLQNILDTDEGARHIGEVALVPHSSPISQSGLLFYNTLYDENASCHIALGRALPFNLKGGSHMSPDDLSARGTNLSMTHVDFMIGSEHMNIDGILADGSVEPVMRSGEWAFKL